MTHGPSLMILICDHSPVQRGAPIQLYSLLTYANSISLCSLAIVGLKIKASLKDSVGVGSMAPAVLLLIGSNVPPSAGGDQIQQYVYPVMHLAF